MKIWKVSTTVAVASAVLSACSATSNEGKSTKWTETLQKHELMLAYAPQTHKVAMGCFPTKLQVILAKLNHKYGKKVIITSGYRPHAGHSQHAFCKAADIRIPGVKGTEIAKFARSIEGIGGVGTYCSGIVHVDVGPRRDWHHC